MSDGQWIPAKILEKEIRKLKIINTTPALMLYGRIANDKAKKKDVCPDGNAGYFGFFINGVIPKASDGLFLL